MTRFHGRVGFGETTEISPGVYTDEIVEHNFYGEVIRISRSLRQGVDLNEDILVGNSISIVGSFYAMENYLAIRYVELAGELWTITSVEIQPPRLILTLGEVYNGPTAAAPVSP